ncbi:unnamed protein product [Mytilus coruscus]|uniref:Uncharacterized protein n=1 Tax=Mytilus coruscus TaxID=42192 RepID=A0A6J8E9H9_MYTCO|nr:unnamed protein product [Mytilus coruscus]
MTTDETPDFKVELIEVVLKACKCRINPAVIYGHAEILKTINAKYPFTKTEVKQIAIAAGTVNFEQDQLFQNTQPNRVVIGFVNALGAADNVPVTGNVMRLNFNATTGRTIIPAFNNMFEVTDKWMHDTDNQLDRNDFAGGYGLFCFEVSPQFGDEGSYLNFLKQGNVRLQQNQYDEMKDEIKNIRFQQGLPTMEDLNDWGGEDGHKLLVLDDLMIKGADSEELIHMMCVGSHHTNVTVIFLIQKYLSQI